MKNLATCFGRDIEGSIEVNDSDREVYDLYQKVVSDYYNKEGLEKEVVEKEIGIVDDSDELQGTFFMDMFNDLGIAIYKNNDEISKVTKENLEKLGFKNQNEYGKFSIIETNTHLVKITYGKDSGQDSWGGVCSNIAIKIQIFEK